MTLSSHFVSNPTEARRTALTPMISTFRNETPALQAENRELQARLEQQQQALICRLDLLGQRIDEAQQIDAGISARAKGKQREGALEAPPRPSRQATRSGGRWGRRFFHYHMHACMRNLLSSMYY